MTRRISDDSSLFGAVFSPSCANFALRKTAEANSQRFDFEVINTVRRNFYVDDCLKSVPSESEAIRLTADLRRLLERGGFNLTKWVSNSRKLIESLPEFDRAGSFKTFVMVKCLLSVLLGSVGTLKATYSVSRSKSTTSPSQEEDCYPSFP